MIKQLRYILQHSLEGLILLAWILFFCQVSHGASAEKTGTTSIDLIECGDRRMEFKILCNPRWPTQRNTQSLKLVIDDESEEVAVTISESEEVGLTFADLTPTALKRVYEYADEFKYAKTFVNWNKAVRVEARPRGQPETHLLDYFLIRDSQLYRISYSAGSAEQFRKYLPLFVKMMKSFEFIKLLD